jgi:hypothetical protein
MQGQQLLETWWLHSIVVVMAIGVADPSFAIRRVGVDEIEKERLGEVKGWLPTISKGV